MSEIKTLSDKLSGRSRRPGDVGGKKVLSAKILRSDTELGRITEIDVPHTTPGVFWVLAKDIPGASRLNFGGVSVPIFAGKHILWRGQPIMAVAGTNPEIVEDWLSGVTVRIDRSDVLPHPEEGQFYRSKGNTEKAFSEASQIIQESFSIPKQNGLSKTTETTCIREGNFYSIHSTTAWPGAVRRSVSRALQIQSNAVTVRPYSSGPGIKHHAEIWHPAVHASIAALLAWKAKRSIRLETTPNEAKQFGPSVPGAEFHIRAAVNAEGRLLGIEVEISIETGALFPLEKEVIDRIILGMFGLYSIRNYTIRGRIKRTPRTPSTLGPAAGFELGALTSELFVSRIAEKTLTSSPQWRLKALPKPDQLMGPGIIKPRDFPIPSMLNRLLEQSDYERKFAACNQSLLSRSQLLTHPQQFHGVGLSCVGFGNGFLGSLKDLGPASLSLTLDKNSVLQINMPPVNSGTLAKAWQTLAGNILGLSPESIRFTNEIPLEGSEPGPSLWGRNVSVYTRLLTLACNDLSKRRFRDALPISTTRTRRRSAHRPWSSELLEGSPFDIYSWGTGVVEVTLSSRTNTVTSFKIWLLIDGGALMMKDYAKAAVENSAEEALSWCLGGLDSQVIPHIDVEFYGDDARRPSRDVSTLPWLLLPSALTQAMRQASGVNIDRLPITPISLHTQGNSQ